MNVALIGAGNIGQRYLQAMLSGRFEWGGDLCCRPEPKCFRESA